MSCSCKIVQHDLRQVLTSVFRMDLYVKDGVLWQDSSIRGAVRRHNSNDWRRSDQLVTAVPGAVWAGQIEYWLTWTQSGFWLSQACV